MTLAEFLLARIAEDERAAHQADPGEWRYDDNSEFPGIGNISSETAEGVYFIAYDHDAEAGYGAVEDENATHIVRWDPARVLAECDAKRRILELHAPQPTRPMDADHEPWCSSCVGFHADYDCENAHYPCPTLKALALPYKDHPDFDAGWAL